MSPPGRPKGEYRSAQREGTPVNRPIKSTVRVREILDFFDRTRRAPG